MVNSPDKYEGFAVLDLSGIIQFSSPEFIHLISVSNTSLVGSSISTLVDSLILDEMIPTLTKPWYTSKILLNGRLKYKSGNKSSYFKLEPISEGSILFVYRNKTELEEHLFNLYSRAFHLNPGLSAITVLNTGKHLDVNKAWLTAMGYEQDEVIGKTSEELDIWEYGDSSRSEIIQQLQKAGKIEGMEARMRTKDGSLLDIIISAESIVYHGKRLAFFTSHDVTRLKIATKQQIILQLKTENLEQLAFVDGLTCVANRRRFDEFIHYEWLRAIRCTTSLSLLMLDIDFFKSYNDRYGHQAGDKCLYAVAQALNSQVQRPGDLLCRYGGEEFCCVLPETDINGAKQIATGMLKAVRDLKIPHIDSQITPFITLSIGISSCIPNTNTQEHILIRHADDNLYKAKSEGRARIVGC